MELLIIKNGVRHESQKQIKVNSVDKFLSACKKLSILYATAYSTCDDSICYSLRTDDGRRFQVYVRYDICRQKWSISTEFGILHGSDIFYMSKTDFKRCIKKFWE